jgi:superfamily I DNA and/or RNA helicase
VDYLQQHSSGGKGGRTERVNIGFMNDHQRLNVALTRAKYGLWLVGDVMTMAASGREGESVWRDLIEHCRNKK